MVKHNTVSPQFQKPRYQAGKKNTNANNRKWTPTQEIQDQRYSEKRRRRNCWIGLCCGLCLAAAVILAGVLPGLIMSLKNSSTSDTTTSADTGGSSGSNTTSATNNSSVTSASSSSSITTFVTNTASTSTGSTTTTFVTNTASTSIGSTVITSSSSVTTGSTASASITAVGFTASGAVLSYTTAYYAYEEVTITNSLDLVNITIVIVAQKTVNGTYRGTFTTFWSGTVNEAYVETSTQIIYTFTIVSGQTIRASGSPYRAQAQITLFGTNQLTSADTFNVTATTTTGITSTLSGHF